MNELTLEQFRDVLPKQVRGAISDDLIEAVNFAISNSELRENFRDNLLSYTSVMRDGKFKIESYINAVKYVSLKLLGSSNIDAYLKTFPDKHQWFIEHGTSSKDISAYVAAYNKTKLVNLIFAQTLVPFHVLNADLYQKALNVQVALMTDLDVSPKVRSDAANSVLTHLKPPEVTKIELDVKDDSSMLVGLRQTMLELAAMQHKNIELGISSAKEIAQSNLVIEGEFTNAMV
jgi:hypothetical protein